MLPSSNLTPTILARVRINNKASFKLNTHPAKCADNKFADTLCRLKWPAEYPNSSKFSHGIFHNKYSRLGIKVFFNGRCWVLVNYSQVYHVKYFSVRVSDNSAIHSLTAITNTGSLSNNSTYPYLRTEEPCPGNIKYNFGCLWSEDFWR